MSGYTFSRKSQQILTSVCPQLKLVLSEAIKYMDFTILEGHRDKKRQLQLFNAGKSKVTESKHNSFPSQAVDIAPYPVDWNDRERFLFLGGLIVGIGKQMGFNIRWGGDWKMAGKLNSEFPPKKRFDDLVHFEITEKKSMF